MTNDGTSIPVESTRLLLSEGTIARHEGKLCRITDEAGLDSVIIEDIESGDKRQVKVEDLEAVPIPGSASDRQPVPLDGLTKKYKKIARRRLKMIKPLLDTPRPSRADFERRAEEVGHHFSTLYRWYGYYSGWEDVTTLAPKKRGWQEGKSRISKGTEVIVQFVIQNYYLKPREQPDIDDIEGIESIEGIEKEVLERPTMRPSIKSTIQWVETLCEKYKVEKPSDSTIRERINRIPDRIRLARRGDTRKAKQKYGPTPGRFPKTNYPLEVVQVDHSDADIVLVDDEGREPIGRIYLTLAFDVYSRMVTGYYLSLDPPSSISVAMCLSHSFLPKGKWLSEKGVEADWPVWGFPKTIHVDNAREFRSNTLKQACRKHNINLVYRPPVDPHYGGHIERGLGTLKTDIHDLPGTTYSSPKDIGDSKPEKNAVFTVAEFEHVLLELICNSYHRREHRKLNMPPLRRWEIGIKGDRKTEGRGLPAVPAKPKEVEIDFLPGTTRTVQKDGVLFGLTYYAPVLNRWIGARDPEHPREARRHTFRYDPGDVNTILFWEPDIGEYFELPTAEPFPTPVSFSELKQAKILAKKEGHDPKSATVINQAVTKIRENTGKSKQKTKAARRKNQRRKEHGKYRSPATVNASVDAADRTPVNEPTSKLSDEPLEEFPIGTLGWTPESNGSGG